MYFLTPICNSHIYEKKKLSLKFWAKAKDSGTDQVHRVTKDFHPVLFYLFVVGWD